jgi:GT2 family glycosyltransferase
MDAAPPGRFSIVVVNYGSSALLEQNLVPVARAVPDAQVVIVDNFTDSAERQRTVALVEREGWQAVLPDGNTGFGAGMNLGVARARELGATSYLLLNPDATIAREQLAGLRERSREHPLALLSPRILRSDGSVWFDGADLYPRDGRIRATRNRPTAGGPRWEPWLSGACLLITDRLWQLVGGFDESYFLYWEDVDLSYRVAQAGGSIELCRDLVAVHDEGGTQGVSHRGASHPKSATYYYYNIRNRMLFAARNLRADDVRRWRRNIIPTAYEVLLQGGRRQFLQSPDPLLAALRGIRDGLRIARRALADARTHT